jgi:hypothetical protein
MHRGAICFNALRGSVVAFTSPETACGLLAPAIGSETLPDALQMSRIELEHEAGLAMASKSRSTPGGLQACRRTI